MEWAASNVMRRRAFSFSLVDYSEELANPHRILLIQVHSHGEKTGHEKASPCSQTRGKKDIQEEDACQEE
ncbi:MAG TPA: hypothetical protein VLA12_19860, partial [Planctomycetaceae bacterium]|nr:hypothetical protein [Planctomycetaceae bacterium]